MHIVSSWSDLFPQLAIFPLHTIEDGACGCGDPDCNDIGKHPDGPWGDISTAEKRRSQHHPRAGYGIATGERSGVLVVDCDGPVGLASFAALGLCPVTFTVRRGPGKHFYFRYPGFRVANTRSALALKVDTRGDGGYIVAPGSPHKSGDRYLIENDAPIADAPPWLLSWLEARSSSAEVHTYEGDVEGETLAYHTRIFREYLTTAPPCVEKSGGDEQLWRVVQYGAYDLALPHAVVLDSIKELYDPRCVPPWGDELERRVAHKVRCAKEHSTRPPNCPVPLELVECSDCAEPETFEAAVFESAPDEELSKIETELKVTWGRWDEEVPPPRYVVQDVIPDDTIGMIVAKGSSLKTWMALSIGIAVANGSPWLGHFAVECGNVLIVDFESGTWQLRHRAKQLGAYSTPGLGHANFPNGRIDDPKFWVKLAKLCKARGVRLVIIDSFAAGAAGVDENDAKAALPLTLAARFTDACTCSVLFIHHAKKGEGGDERDLVRGTGAIYAALDWAVTMIPQDDNRTRMKVRNIKPWGPRPEDFGIELTKDGSLILDVETAEKAPREEGRDVESAIMAALVRPIANRALVAKAIGKNYQDTIAHLDALVEKRVIAKLPAVGYTIDDDEKRVSRVRKALEGSPCRSIAELSRRAVVDQALLQDWYASGRLCLSGRQYMMTT